MNTKPATGASTSNHQCQRLASWLAGWLATWCSHTLTSVHQNSLIPYMDVKVGPCQAISLPLVLEGAHRGTGVWWHTVVYGGTQWCIVVYGHLSHH